MENIREEQGNRQLEVASSGQTVGQSGTRRRAAGKQAAAQSPFRKLAWAIPLLLLGMLLYDTFGVSSTRTTLGPLSVAVAVTPQPVEAGPAILHVQLSTADGRRPVEELQVSARALDPGQAASLPVTSKAVGGAYEVHFSAPAAGGLDLELSISGAAPLGTLVYRIEPGRKGATLVRTVPSP